MKLKYIGTYAGTVVLSGHNVTPGCTIEVSEEVGEKLLSSGQFEKVVEESLVPGGES